jgi:hypothetical protein
MSIIQGNSKTSAAGGYTIDQSIRFNDDDSAYLEKTFASAGDRQIWTWSAWIKLSGSTARQIIFGAAGGPSYISINENATGSAFFNLYNAGWYWETAAKYRDPSAWYHLVWAFDTTNATADNRMRFYVNGSEVTDYSTKHATGSQNASGDINNNVVHRIGRHPASTNYYDGYLAEINFVDGQQLAPTDFGETNADTGEWVPVEYTGSYGTNGFYITGADSADLGADDSGNGNDFTSSGLTAADQMLDTPSLNAATLNPLWTGAGLSDGNLVATATGSSYQRAISTFAIDDGGKYACEFQKSSGTFGLIGIMQLGNNTVTSGNSNMYGYNVGTGEVFKANPTASVLIDLGAGAANSLMRVEYDSSADTIKIFDDGVEIFPAATGVSNTVGLTGHSSLHFGCAPFGSGTVITATFQGLSGTPTADFLELTSANLPDPTIADPSAYFQTTLYTGNGVGSGSGGQEINQVGNSTFQPDFVWNRVRNLGTETHCLQDVVRGADKRLQSNSTAAENTETEGLLSFDSDGFTVGSRDPYNKNTATYVAWQWLADNTTGSSNTDGSITSTVSAGTSGFSIVSYTGTGANATVGHGLGVAPKMIIVKNLDESRDWVVYHEDVGATKGLYLNLTSAQQTVSTFFNNTAPTSSVFTVGAGSKTNGSSDGMIAYCFADVDGFSRISSFVGNGSNDGPMVYTGFRPAHVVIKEITAADSWEMYDSARDPINVTGRTIRADSANAEFNGTGGTRNVDFVSNGFKIRTSNATINSSGATYIFWAFAESPFRYANAR